VAALAEHGQLGRLFADGQVPAIELCLIREALARSCPDAETAFGVQGLGAYPILQSGLDPLRDEWVPRVAAGTAVAGFALTERDAGSDVRAMTLAAEPDPAAGEGGYRVTGEKLWISNAPDADIYTVFARAPEGITAFAVPGDAPGLGGEHKLLLAEHAIGSLTFDGVAVGREQVLGEPGAGFKVAMRTLDLFRPSVGAFAIGMARHALEHLYREVRAPRIYEGANEIQREIIARGMFRGAGAGAGGAGAGGAG
jgi:acyl-CoA dehydrogenase